MEKSFKEKLLEDIQKTGFPLELNIANKFMENNWSIKHSAYYIDKDEKKGREIDLNSSIYLNEKIQDTYIEIVFSLIIEIKKATSKPWVIFTTERDERIENILTKNIVSSGFNIETPTIFGVFHNKGTKLNDKIGRSFYEGFSGNGSRDDIYKALAGTIKALHHFKESSSAHDKTTDRLIEYFEPIIVVDGNLFEAYIDDKDKINLQEAEYIQAEFEYLSPNYNNEYDYTTNYVHIMKTEYLDTFIKEKEQILKDTYKAIKHLEFESKKTGRQKAER